MYSYFAVRKWRSKSTLKGQGPWEIEVGEPVPSTVACLESDVIKENCSNVSCIIQYLHLLYFRPWSKLLIDSSSLSPTVLIQMCQLILWRSWNSLHFHHFTIQLIINKPHAFNSTMLCCISSACIYAQRHKDQFPVESPEPSVPQRGLQHFSGAWSTMLHHTNK